MVRRLHDVGKIGCLFFIVLSPIIGVIKPLVLYYTEEDLGEQQFDSDPKNNFDKINEIGITKA